MDGQRGVEGRRKGIRVAGTMETIGHVNTALVHAQRVVSRFSLAKSQFIQHNLKIAGRVIRTSTILLKSTIQFLRA